MTLTRNQWLSMQLAGTVSIPPTLPDQVLIKLVPVGDSAGSSAAGVRQVTRELLLTEQAISPRVTIRRYFPVEDVTAIQNLDGSFRNDTHGGNWFFGQEITCGPAADRLRTEGFLGIAYIREQAPAFMQVDVGMTAAESAEYYPPLPGDRSQDHYQFGTVHSATSHSFCSGGAPCSAWRVPTTMGSKSWSSESVMQPESPAAPQPASSALQEPADVPVVAAAAKTTASNGHSSAEQEEAHAT
jgi:hypothetical protein